MADPPHIAAGGSGVRYQDAVPLIVQHLQTQYTNEDGVRHVECIRN